MKSLHRFNQTEQQQHFEEMQARVRVLLKELGVEEQTPTIGVLKITYHVIREFWREFRDELEQEPEEEEGILTIHSEPHEGDMPDARDIVLRNEEGETMLLAVISSEREMHMVGHVFTIANGGWARGRHHDDTICTPRCSQCEKEAVKVTMVDGTHYYGHCVSCGAHTGLYTDRWLALGAFMVGILQESHTEVETDHE